MIYGVLNMFRKLLLQNSFYKMIIVFDSPKKTFRHNLFEQYKKNRSAMPVDLKQQIQSLYIVIKLLNIPTIIIPYVEADDVIGTLSYKAEKKGYFTLIATRDKDIAQLVTENINIIDSIKNIIIGPEIIKKKYGIPPKLIIDFLALVGDTSDNIPGVIGIGEKTATILLTKLGTIEEIYAKIENIQFLSLRGTNNIIRQLKKNKQMAFLSKKLATIKLDVSLHEKYNNFNLPIFQQKKILFFLKNYIRNYYKKING